MEKYARQALSEGVKNSDEIRVSGDSELYRVLNLHYNRNNHIEVRDTMIYCIIVGIHKHEILLAGDKIFNNY